MKEKIYTVQEIANELRISIASVKRLCASGEFPGAYKISTAPKSHWRIPESGLNAYLAKMKK